MPKTPKTDIRSNPPLIMSISEAASYLGVSERNVRQKMRARVLPFLKLGRRILLRRDTLNSALAKLEIQSV